MDEKGFGNRERVPQEGVRTEKQNKGKDSTMARSGGGLVNEQKLGRGDR